MKNSFALLIIVLLSIIFYPFISYATALSHPPILPHPNTPMLPSLLPRVPAPPKSDSLFVADTGGDLDRYLKRADVTNGRLAFDIPIDRYYSSLITPISAPGGYLPDDLRDTLVITRHLLPLTATLRLRLFDVNSQATPCPAVHQLYVNSYQIRNADNSSVRLGGIAQTWTHNGFAIPIEYLKFPTTPGASNQPPAPALNRIEVALDTQCFNRWALEVDWATLEIVSPIRPIVMAHGFTGAPSNFQNFTTYLTQDGIPYAEPVALDNGITPISQESAQVAATMSKAMREFGVDKVNLIAHSKGGLVSRLATDGANADHLITLSTPHHGISPIESSLVGVLCLPYFFNPPLWNLCNASAGELGEDRVRSEMNYVGCEWQWLGAFWSQCRPIHAYWRNVDYRTLVGATSLCSFGWDFSNVTTTYPWRANQLPFPSAANVDATFNCLHHTNIYADQQAYRCAISFMDERIYARSNCPSPLPRPLEPAERLFAPAQARRVAAQAAQLNANAPLTLTASLADTPSASFIVVSTAPVSFTLNAPDGRRIAADAADVRYRAAPLNDSLWWQQYQLSQPAAGSWRSVLQAPQNTAFYALTLAAANATLAVNTARFTYAPNSVITVETALITQSQIISTGVSFTGLVTLPNNSTFSLSFVDDGANGDRVAGDGIYTSQFNVGNDQGRAKIGVAATHNSINYSDETPIAISTQSAQLIGVLSETPLDLNGNGFYDQLQFNVQLSVQTSAHLRLDATLLTSSHQHVASAFYATRLTGTGALASGLHTLTLSFRGAELRAANQAGPYTLAINVVDQSNESVVVETNLNARTTAAYSPTQFEGVFFSMTSGSAHSVIDATGNGKYEQLLITVPVTTLAPGDYAWNGRLVDANGGEVAWTMGNGTISDVTPLVFVFDGGAIRDAQRDGPYTLRDVSIVRANNGNVAALWDTTYTTSAYSWGQFERLLRGYLPLIVR